MGSGRQGKQGGGSASDLRFWACLGWTGKWGLMGVGWAGGSLAGFEVEDVGLDPDSAS